MKKTLLASALMLAFSLNANAALNGGSYSDDVSFNQEVDGEVFAVLPFDNVEWTGSKFESQNQQYGVYVTHDYLSYGSGPTQNLYVNLGKEGSTIDFKLNSNSQNAIWVRNNWSNHLSHATIRGDSLTITGSGTYGVILQNLYVPSATTPLDEQCSINLLSDNTTITGVETAIFSTGGGVINVKGKNLVIDATNAIAARGHSTINIDSETTQIKGDVVFAYDGYETDSDVNINLSGKDSYWEGTAVLALVSNAGSNADHLTITGLDVSLTDGAKWIPTDIEAVDISKAGEETRIAVNNLTLSGGIIEVGTGIGAEVETLTGEGTVHMDSANPGTFAVTKDGSEATLSVTMTGDSDTVTEEQAKAVLASVTGVDDKTATVDEGMYNGAMTIGADGTVTTVTNSVMSNVLDLASAQSLYMNRILMNDVRKRLGDLRSAEGTHGVWARYDGGKLSGSNEYENDFTTIQVGIDTVPVVDAPRFGVAFAYTTADADMKRGGAEMDAFSLAFYGTKMYDNGMFVDVIGRMATADTDVVVDGDKKGTMDNVALSLSGELGWRFDVTEKFYFEPQAELTYTYVNADTLTLSDESQYKFDSVDSLMGRVGFAAGFKCPNNFGDVYVRASAVHEFLGDAAVIGGKNIHEVDGEDTWVEFGIGANFNVNKNTYVYADIERTEGAKLEEDWRANVGVRFAF